MAETIKIKKIFFLRLMLLSRGGKDRNKALMKHLAAWNLEMWPTRDISSALGLDSHDLDLLEELAHLEDGWHPYESASEGVVGNPERLAGLGLIRLKWRPRRICLTDAGRFLLVLTAAA